MYIEWAKKQNESCCSHKNNNVLELDGEWYLEKRGSRKILAGSRNLVFAWFGFTLFESRNLLPRCLRLGFLTRISASRRVSDFTIRQPYWNPFQLCSFDLNSGMYHVCIILDTCRDKPSISTNTSEQQKIALRNLFSFDFFGRKTRLFLHKMLQSCNDGRLKS